MARNARDSVGGGIGGAADMLGRQNDEQAKLFYEFCLEDRVPSNHLLRKIDRFIDLSELRTHLAPFYSNLGRPSVDPDLAKRPPASICISSSTITPRTRQRR